MFRTIAVLILLLISEIAAQSPGSYYNPKDDKYRLLGLKRAKEQYEAAKMDYERNTTLFDKQMISMRELERAKSAYADAEVNYHQALLAVLFEQQYVSVVEAIKYQSKEGKNHVRIKLANTSGGGGEEFKKLINIDDALFKSLQPEVINDVYVSLLNESNAIISQPYEAKIEELHYGKPATVDFALLQDLDAVTVNIIYGSGTQRAPKIFLQKDQSVNKVVFRSDQFSQEANLGSSASFNMSLELFSGSTNVYKLEALSLPRQINRFFIDPSTQARLSQFKFNESSQTRKTNLQVYLPDRPTGDVQIDQPISFFVAAIPYEKLGEFENKEEKNWTKDELDRLDIGYLKLEIVPRGTGELKVNASQLFFTSQSNNIIEVAVDIKNEGTRRLDNVEFELDLPINWRYEANPKIIQSLDIREEKRVVFTFTPNEDVTVGKYDIRLRTTSLADDKPVKAEDKTITVEIKESANIFGTLLLIILIVGLVAGVVIFGIKLTRK